jgi:hypothetical protein
MYLCAFNKQCEFVLIRNQGAVVLPNSIQPISLHLVAYMCNMLVFSLY